MIFSLGSGPIATLEGPSEQGEEKRGKIDCADGARSVAGLRDASRNCKEGSAGERAPGVAACDVSEANPLGSLVPRSAVSALS